MPDEVSTMFTVQNPPWHGKGKVLDRPQTASEAIVQAGLDWEVQLREMTLGGIPIQDYFAVQRMDNMDVLGVVGKRYHPIQNHELFSFFDPVVDRDEAIYHTAGVLRDGKIVWLLAKLDSEFYVVNGDKVENYILLTTSHDGSMAITAKSTQVRVVCANTLAVALGGSSTRVNIRHTRNAVYELQQAHKVLGMATKAEYKMKELAYALLDVKVVPKFLRRMIQRAIPTQRDDPKKNKHLEPIEMLFESDPTCNLPGMSGTGWAAYNALTKYLDHQWQTRGDSLYRTWLGGGNSIRNRAIRALMGQIE